MKKYYKINVVLVKFPSTQIISTPQEIIIKYSSREIQIIFVTKKIYIRKYDDIIFTNISSVHHLKRSEFITFVTSFCMIFIHCISFNLNSFFTEINYNLPTNYKFIKINFLIPGV